MIKESVIEVKTSKNGHLVPVINQIHLHSIYNPVKEAEQFVQKNYHKLNPGNPNLLIFGLGFGYHINELQKKIAQDENLEKVNIFVIEPFDDLYKQCLEQKLITPNKNLKIFTGVSVESYFNNLELIDFLVKKPCILSHPASFNLNINFFKEFLSYEAPKTLKSIEASFRSQELKTYFGQFEQFKTMESALEELESSKIPVSNDMDFLALAFKSLIEPKH